MTAKTAQPQTILLVDDDAGVRGIIRAMLVHEGYTVLEASGGQEALAQIETRGIDLLLTDVIMPGMHGRELAERVIALQPRAKVIFLSGYTDETIVRHQVLGTDVNYVAKPFSPEGLLEKVQQVLGTA